MNNSDQNIVGLLKASLKSQYHAGLAMLKQAIEKCPQDLWVNADYTNPFWRIAYHNLYFVHLYIQPRFEDFKPWEHHQTCIQDLDNQPAPENILKFSELPHRPPQTGEPYTKTQMLEYWEFCANMIDEAVDKLDVLSPESGFYWYKIPKIEHQIVNIRHLQHHTAQLADRIRNVVGIGVDWAGARGRKPYN
ncbi:MAG: hypothetical protein ABIJ45_06120 [Candidatus Zixiibacteriota bacterium]